MAGMLRGAAERLAAVFPRQEASHDYRGLGWAFSIREFHGGKVIIRHSKPLGGRGGFAAQTEEIGHSNPPDPHAGESSISGDAKHPPCDVNSPLTGILPRPTF
jgi:hypothetical protein